MKIDDNEVALVHCNIINNYCQQYLIVLLTFYLLIKSLDILDKNFIFSKSFSFRIFMYRKNIKCL